jgi:branched-chain amino acid transport system permease protein
MFFGQMVVSGLVTGAIYALIAVGLVVIYKASSVLNFGYGQISAVAAFVSFSLLTSHGASWPVAMVVGMSMSTILSLATEFAVVRPFRGQRPLTIVVGTFAVALILAGLITLEWGADPRLYPPMITGNAFSVAGLSVTAAQTLLVVVTLGVIFLIAGFFKFTRIGLSMRAAAENQTVATLLGINLHVVSIVSWGVAGALGGLAAVLIAPQVILTPDSIGTIMVQAFMAVVLAGFTNLLGAVVGGFITGVALNLFAGYVVSDMPNTFLLLMLLAVLLVRPHGIFGKAEVMRL